MDNPKILIRFLSTGHRHDVMTGDTLIYALDLVRNIAVLIGIEHGRAKPIGEAN